MFMSLKWNDFPENTISTFQTLRRDREFSDVTLACEDGQQVEAHKVILASSSPFFEKLLKKNKHPHPLIYMRGLKSEDLVTMIDFLYLGEANVQQENLDSFLAVAEELQLKGFMGSGIAEEVEKEGKILPLPGKLPKTQAESYIQDGTTSPESVCSEYKDVTDPHIEESATIHQGNKRDNYSANYEHTKNEDHQQNYETLGIFTSESEDSLDPLNASETLSDNSVAVDLHALDEQIKSLMEIRDNTNTGTRGTAWNCKVCGMEDKYSSHLKNHIEAQHITGISHTCNICGKSSSTRDGLRRHKINLHDVNTRPNHHSSPFKETLSLTGNTLSTNLQELNEKINSMMEATEKSMIFGSSRQKVFVCKVCGKEDQRSHLKSHIEAYHSGVSFTCNICGKLNRTRESLRKHTKTHHID